MNINIIFTKNCPTLTYAAEELKSYLSLLDIKLNFAFDKNPNNFIIKLEVKPDLTKYELPIIENSYLDDQYYINITSAGGHIIGTNSRSVLLGVYSYLYQLGFRFLYPDKRYDYIPKRQLIENLFITHSAAASQRHRGICIEGSNSVDNILDFIDWMPKLGFNCFFVQFKLPYTFMSRWYEHVYNPYLNKEEFNENIALEYSNTIDEALQKRSLLHHRVGHGWTSEAIDLNSSGWEKTTKEPAPEIQPFLAQLDGKYSFFEGVPTNTNLCYSNTDVIECFSNKVVSYAKDHPEVDYLHVWLADEPNNICECTECKKTTPTDQYIHLMNMIDKKLIVLGLPTHIVFLLYQELLWAPQTERLNHPKRFTLMFAPISRTFETSYPTAEAYTKPPLYIRNQVTLPISLEENMSFLKEWQAFFAGDSFIYDYPLGRAHYGDLSYLSIARVISSDIQSLHKLHMNGYISCQELRSGLPNTFPNYVMGYTLFNNNLTFETLLQDYYKHAYGDDYMLAISYMEHLSSLYSCDYFNGKGPRENLKLHNNFEQALRIIQAFRNIICKNLINTGKTQSFFWELLDYHAEYSLRLTKALSSLSRSDIIEANELFNDFHKFICSNENNYQACLDVYRITEVSTKYTGFKLEDLS